MKDTLAWRAVDGGPISCAEKLKVLDQNLAEFRDIVLDLLEDASLMGCDVDQVRAVLKATVDQAKLRFSPG